MTSLAVLAYVVGVSALLLSFFAMSPLRIHNDEWSDTLKLRCEQGN